jgi:rare lipoprotein A (peptidoglycan hydrolase)
MIPKPLRYLSVIVLALLAVVMMMQSSQAANLENFWVTLDCNNRTFPDFNYTLDRDNTGTGQETFRVTITDGQGTILHLAGGTYPLGNYFQNGGTYQNNQFSAVPLDNIRIYTWASVAGNGLPEQIAYRTIDPDCTSTAGSVPISVAIGCFNGTLEIDLDNGDGPFNISGTGPGLPLSNVPITTSIANMTVLNGPGPWSGIIITETGGDGQSMNMGSYNCGAPANTPLSATAACSGANLVVNIASGDGPFNITGTGPGLPANSVSAGNTTLTGPGSWTAVTVTETTGNGETLNLGSFNCAAPTVPLSATATCNGPDLVVNIASGDGPFNITGTGPGLPANGVSAGNTTLTGPGSWTAVTVTETTGNGETLNLGSFNCAAPTVPLSATATCNGPDLVVNIASGDGPFNITGTGPGLPANGVSAGNTTLTGPGSWTAVTVTETTGNGETLNLGSFNCAAPTIPLSATAACNGPDLVVNIASGDGPFNITGTGPGLPANGVNTGSTTLTGPGSWTAVTVTETTGNGETLNLGDFNCAAVGPQYDSTPSPNGTINFGSVLVGSSQTRTLTVREVGNAQLDINLSGITGAHAADFSVLSPAFPISIADGGADVTITLQCTPAALGARTAQLTLTSNDPARATVNYTLSCQGATETKPPSDNKGKGSSQSVAAPPPVPLCADFNGSTNNIVRADVPAGTVNNGSVFCRVLNENGQFRVSASEVGNASILSQGVLQAVDVFGLLHNGVSIARFDLSVTICLRGSGSLIYLDATGIPRVARVIPASSSGGYTCGSIPNAGTVVLVNGTAQAAPAASSAPAANVTSLTDCRVTTTNIVRLRSEPTTDSAILYNIPFQTVLQATAHTVGWTQVIYLDQQGWVNDGYLQKQGNCG